MNLRRRSIFVIVVVLVILVIVFVFNVILSIPYGEGGRSYPISLTVEYIETQNHIIETLISQTQTATAQAPTATAQVPTGTFTPVPSS